MSDDCIHEAAVKLAIYDRAGGEGDSTLDLVRELVADIKSHKHALEAVLRRAEFYELRPVFAKTIARALADAGASHRNAQR
jgi:hypothetical protein